MAEQTKIPTTPQVTNVKAEMTTSEKIHEQFKFIDFFTMTEDELIAYRETELENFEQELKATEYFKEEPEHVVKIMQIMHAIEPYKLEVLKHDLYREVSTVEECRLFMESHVFAVWDFMSLLKTLQWKFTCLSAPWAPVGEAALRRMINSIVVAEESDLDETGKVMSHFEMYCYAMKQAGCCTEKIDNFVKYLMEQHNQLEIHYTPRKDSEKSAYKHLMLEKTKSPITIYESDCKSKIQHKNVEVLPRGISQFVDLTLNLCENSRDIHRCASGFAFGREDLICPMFMSILKELGKKEEIQSKFSKLLYYLERHIEVDGDDHGPLSMEMISVCCGNDEEKWVEAERVAIQVMESRKILWDHVLEKILKRRKNGQKRISVAGSQYGRNSVQC